MLDESCGRFPVLAQMSCLQAMRVYGLDDLAKQRAKSSGDLLQFVIERVLVQVLIDVAHQVDQAFLLSARHRIVRGVKIGDKYAVEPIEHIL